MQPLKAPHVSEVQCELECLGKSTASTRVPQPRSARSRDIDQHDYEMHSTTTTIVSIYRTLANMTVEDLITDPALRPLLLNSQATLAQTQSIITWLSEHHSDQPSQEAQLDLSRQQKVLNALLAKLRSQNRRAAYGARETKQETAEARQEVDRLLLQLQNLYYEQRHLMGEIGACEGYE